jgi:hypothetical protein
MNQVKIKYIGQENTEIIIRHYLSSTECRAFIDGVRAGAEIDGAIIEVKLNGKEV